MSPRFIEFHGRFRRLIDLKAWDAATVVGWLEDDVHHFGVTLVHDGKTIRDVHAAAPRHPWATCPAAGEALRALIGQPLFGRCSEIGQLIDMRLQCTHLYDLAGLLAAHAYHRREHHRYHATLERLDASDPQAPAGWLHAELVRDDARVLWWDLCGDEIKRPADSAGRFIERGFREWTEGMDELDAEYACVLRRAAYVGKSRTVVVDDYATAGEIGLPAVCHTYQPEYRSIAFRTAHEVRHFDKGAEGMLSHVDEKP